MTGKKNLGGGCVLNPLPPGSATAIGGLRIFIAYTVDNTKGVVVFYGKDDLVL